MSIRNTADEGEVALFDSTTGMAFGPIFDDADQAEDYLAFARRRSEEDLFGQRPLESWDLRMHRHVYREWEKERLDADGQLRSGALVTSRPDGPPNPPKPPGHRPVG